MKLTKNEFSNLFEIPYCTLTRIMKEIEHCLIDKYKIIMQKEISNDKKDKNNINIGENIDREKKNEIIIIEENNLVSKTSLKENKERKILFNFIMNNLQNLEVKQTNIMGKEKENNSFHILLNE